MPIYQYSPLLIYPQAGVNLPGIPVAVKPNGVLMKGIAAGIKSAVILSITFG